MNKIINLSNLYYNKGLKYASENSLSFAISELKISLTLNKENTQARNLLGLCLFEMGNVAEAICEWIISHGYKGEGNLADDFLKRFQYNTLLLNRYRDYSHLYNEALNFSINSPDLAIIRLKRALEINPNFVLGLNLLALLYIKNDNKESAIINLEKVLNIDFNNKFAKDYLDSIKSKKQEKSHKGPKKRESQQNYVYSQQPQYGKIDKKSSNFGAKTSIFLFIVGGLLTFVFMQFLILPSISENLENEIYALEQEITTQQQQNILDTASLNALIADLEQQNQTLNAELTAANNTLGIVYNEQRVTSSSALVAQGMYMEALYLLDLTNVAQLSVEMSNVLENLMQVIAPQAEVRLYDDGFEHFELGNYNHARQLLDRANALEVENSTTRDDVLYLLGRIAEIDGDYILARHYYEYIINSFPANATARPGALQRLSILDENE